jgi:hypothetical protein
MKRLLTVNIREAGTGQGLLGRDRYGRPYRALRVREQFYRGGGDWRDKIYAAMRACEDAGEHELADELRALLEPSDAPEEDEANGRQSMESYLYGGVRCGLSLRESRPNRGLKAWANRILYS